MKTTRRRSRAKPRIGDPKNALGSLLANLRAAKKMSLRNVEEETGGSVSNAYLSQLEQGRIRKPSPNVLHSLAAVYGAPYEVLMEKAGYVLPATATARSRRIRAFAIDDLTAEEEEELLKYLAFLRWRGPRS